MTQRRRAASGREQAATPFAGILMRLCDNTGASCAALVDREGESVDYAGNEGSYEIRVMAAELRLVLAVVLESRIPTWTDSSQIIVRAKRRSFAIVPLPEGYALVLGLPPHSFTLSRRAVSEAAREVCLEAGLASAPTGRRTEHWSRVEVQTSPGDPRRPSALWVGSAWCRVDVLGRYPPTMLERGEIGFRARLANGAEVSLVREQLGRWYAEDLPEH